MNKRPIRRRFKDNPYELIINNNLYLIKFMDSKRKLQVLEVSYEVFKVFDTFELKDLSQMNEYDNHIEHADLCDDELYRKKFEEDKSVQDIVEDKITIEKLKEVIKTLPENQKRRLIKHYFYDKTYEEIAIEEGCTKRAIKFSIDIAIEKISKNFKN